MNRKRLFMFLSLIAVLAGGWFAAWNWIHPGSTTLSMELPQVVSVTFSPDEKLVAVGAVGVSIRPVFSRELCLWETQTGDCLRCLLYENDQKNSAREVSFSPDGKKLQAWVDDTWKTWDVATGRLLSTEPAAPHDSGRRFEVFGEPKVLSHDGMLYAVIDNNISTGNPWISAARVKLFNVQGDKLLQVISFGYTDWSQHNPWTQAKVRAVKFSSSGRMMAISTEMGEVQILHLKEKPRVVIVPMNTWAGVGWNALALVILVVYMAVISLVLTQIMRPFGLRNRESAPTYPA